MICNTQLHLEEDSVAAEQLKLVHLGHGERHHRVVIVDCVLDNQTIGSLLLVEDRSSKLISEDRIVISLTVTLADRVFLLDKFY